MAQGDRQAGPTRSVAQLVKKLRDNRGLSASALAQAMTDLGIRWDRSIVANLETGRRGSVSIEELLGLAYCLDIAPVHLLAGLDDAAQFPVTPTLSVPAADARQWIRGWPHSRDGLPGTNGHRYRENTPASEDVMVTVTEAEWDALQARLRQGKG